MTETCRVVLNGFAEQHAHDAVAEKLAALMKIELNVALDLLKREKVTIKSGISKSDAERYELAVSNTGAKVIIEPDLPDLTFQIPKTIESVSTATSEIEQKKSSEKGVENSENIKQETSRQDTGANDKIIANAKELISDNFEKLSDAMKKKDVTGTSLIDVANSVKSNFHIGYIKELLFNEKSKEKINASMTEIPTPSVFLGTLGIVIPLYLILSFIGAKTGSSFVTPFIVLIQVVAIPVSVLFLFIEINTPRNIDFNSIFKVIAAGFVAGVLYVILIKLILQFEFGWRNSLISALDYLNYLYVIALYPLIVKCGGKFKLNYILLGAAFFVGFKFSFDAYRLVFSYGSYVHALYSTTPFAPFTGTINWVILTFAYCVVRGTNNSWIETLSSTSFWALASVPIALRFFGSLDMFSFVPGRIYIVAIIGWFAIYKLWDQGIKELIDKTSGAGFANVYSGGEKNEC